MEDKFFLEKSRIPVFIGKNGQMKKKIEDVFNCQINIDSKTGDVFVKIEDELSRFILSNVILAINFGQNPLNALKLLDENYVVDVLDVKTEIKNSSKIKSIVGRVIGKDGSTRKTIEEITKCFVSISDSKICVIGAYENIILIHEALLMLIKGASHKSFYSYLERNKNEISSGLL